MTARPTDPVESVGVLALQGGVEPHLRALAALGRGARPVRAPADLAGLTHLVLPGGESTTLARLLRLFELWEPIVAAHRAGELALFGTCAGAILLGRAGPEGDPRPERMELLDARVERNAYGRQVASTVRPVAVEGLARPFPGVFIRAPRIRGLGPGVRVLGTAASDAGGGAPEPVLVAAPGLLAATFHPELSADPALHELFLALEPGAHGPGKPLRKPSASC